ncbi:crosslink repair DNA glycosylase YcaQ family protein [Streptomyces sp. NBC_00083]|uniref:DNA glycosylase AlkZ-like family protein n=1 Tax=Streptomyces sp. NBC_00083 TaxID=2975647 RepID=UPI002257B44E|nr:crosslink repair DNA glycosylase YcaQ family protein [Streptomyces sp. NBC_00083]MCX5387507.1 winged helix DNA-binding domain-containing protein [Streptomyces sp. NBC_00083]
MSASPRPEVELSLTQARSVAVAAVFPPGDRADVPSVLGHLHAVQLDSISVLARAHQLTLATRIPHATTGDVDAALNSGSPPAAFVYPAHALSLVPLADWPLWAFRRRHTRTRPQYPDTRQRAALIARIRADGPLPLRSLRTEQTITTGWGWGPTKAALEFMVWAGDLACTRYTSGQRLFDLPERCIPRQLLDDSLDDGICLTRLLEHAATTLGLGTVDDYADYLRIRPATAERLLPRTALTPVTVQGWGSAWAHPAALGRPEAALWAPVFVGPFDNLIWHRPRVQRLFGFTQVFEAYKPAARRAHGYYVCPLLADGRLIARADLASTSAGLTIHQASFEPHAGPETAAHFASACRTLATTTGTHRISIEADAADPPTTAALRKALR